jgi:hypothetical protein
MIKVNSALLGLVLTLSSLACASQTNERQIVATQHSVDAQVFFRAWSTKEFGEPIESESLTVIASPDEKGDIVVLRKNEGSGGFTAEVYRPDADIEKPRIWNLTHPEGQKSIVRQPDGSFHLSELISGKEGGRRIEAFKLGGPAQQP